MDIILDTYTADLKKSIDLIVESFIKGICHTWIDYDNDRLVVSIIDTHNHMWHYELALIKSELYKGISATRIAHNVITDYSAKIFSEYFK